MQDEIGIGKPHEVLHRRMTYLYGTESGTYASPIAVAPYGREVDIGLDSRWAKENVEWFPEPVAWDLQDHLEHPWQWTIGSPTHDESIVINDLRKKANGLKADILLNLIEANQVIPAVKQVALSLPKAATQWTSIRRVIRNASSNHLALKFGILPLMSDFVSIWKYLPKMKSDIAKRAKMEPIRLSKTFLHTASFGATPQIQVVNSLPLRSRTYQGIVQQDPYTRYVLVVKPKIEYQSAIFNAIDTCVNRFASSPASLAWELVPFSFVVDWLVDLRGTLALIDRSLGFEPYEIVSFTRSRGYALHTDGFMSIMDVSNGQSLHDTKAVQVDYRHYERSLISQSASPIWRPRVGKTQVGIIAALLGQKLSGLKVRR